MASLLEKCKALSFLKESIPNFSQLKETLLVEIIAQRPYTKAATSLLELPEPFISSAELVSWTRRLLDLPLSHQPSEKLQFARSSPLPNCSLGKSFKSAIVISPPGETWGPIQEIREKYDKAFSRWMPHINIVWPFVKEDHFLDVIDEISTALANVRSFTIQLRTFSQFEHTKSCVMWLNPEAEIQNSLQNIYNVLTRAFPQYKDVSRPFTPHLTVGQFPKKQIQQIQAKFQQGWIPIEWEVTEVHIISREGDDEPFSIKHRIKLN